MLLEIAPHRAPSEEQAVLLGRQHLDQLPASGEQLLQGGDRVVRQRPGLGSDPLGEAGEHLGIERIGLGQLPSGFGEVAHLAGIGDDDRQAGRGQRGDEGAS